MSIILPIVVVDVIAFVLFQYVNTIMNTIIIPTLTNVLVVKIEQHCIPHADHHDQYTLIGRDSIDVVLIFLPASSSSNAIVPLSS